jgi:glycosyltransferase involved in cell wall biosynthesis
MSADATGRTRVLILSQDLLGPQMAGPGLRYWELTRVLSQHCAVTLAGPLAGDLPHTGWELAPLSLAQPEELTPLLARTDVVISNGFMLYNYPQLADLRIPWVVDAYIPSPTEGLAYYAAYPIDEQLAVQRSNAEVLRRFATCGDFFLCANDRQRDLYLGVLAAVGRLNPLIYAQDPTLRTLIEVVPFGLPAEPPQRTRPLVKGVSIPAGARLLVWGGGVWDWLDPLTLLRALPAVLRTLPETYLYFPGPRHPFTERIPDMAMHRRTRALADELGLTGTRVLFGDWVPHAERANYLLEGDIGLSLHYPGVETRYAYRTRVLDYIWAGLPMVLSAGDALSELVAERGLGYVVPPEDPARLAQALIALLSEPDARAARAAAFAALASDLTWERVAQPLLAFCRAPRLAADKGAAPPQEPAHDADAGSAQADALRTERDALRAERDALQAQVRAYENGRFMRAMAWLKERRRAAPPRERQP